MSSSTWYTSPDEILGALKEDRRERAALPRIPGYDDIQELHRGGQGIVYLATQRSTRRRVAVKLLLEGVYASASARRRFEREIDVISSLRHPNVVTIFDSGTTADGYLYYVMEFIEGETLEKRILDFGFWILDWQSGRSSRGGRSSASRSKIGGDQQHVRTSPAGEGPIRTPTGREGLGIRTPHASEGTGERGSCARETPESSVGSPTSSVVGSDRLPQSKIQNPKSKIEHPQSKIDDARSKVAEIVSLFAKICDAVAFAHQHGVIHRDLKPGNVRVDRAGEPHVLDFGLAKAVAEQEPAARQALSMTGQFVGSLPWASPEQVAGKPLDTRTDVYSLGVLGHQMLTGTFPYDMQGSFLDVSRTIVSAEPRRLASVSRLFSADLDAIVTKCLSKAPEQRYQTASELAHDLRCYLAGEPVSARRDSAWLALRRRAKRYRVALITLSTAATALLVVAASLAYMVRQTSLARTAEREARIAAQEQATAAETAKKKAEAETRKAVEIRDFLQQTFDFITPERARGRDTSLLREAMDDAARRLPAASAEQPENETVLRRVIGSVYSSLSRYDDAEPHLLRALELSKTVHGPDHPETLMAMNNVGVLRLDQGRWAEAHAALADTVAARSRVFGAQDKDTLVSKSNLAVAAKRLGRLDEAQRIYDDILPPIVAAFGEEHAETLRVLVNLAGLLAARGEVKEAAKLDRRAYDARLRVSGPDHRATITARSNLALSLSTLDEFDEAESLLRDNLERSRRILGAEHDDTLITVNNLAHLLQRRGKLREAEEFFREAFETRKRRLGEEHANTLLSMSNLAMCLLNENKSAEAEPLIRRVLDIRRRANGDEHLDTLISMNNLASFLADRPAGADGHAPAGGGLSPAHAEADQLYRTVATTADKTLGANHWTAALFHGNRGGFLLKLKRLDEAERELLDSYAKLVAALGENHTHARGVATKLSMLYEALGKADESAAWKAKATPQPTTSMPQAKSGG